MSRSPFLVLIISPLAWIMASGAPPAVAAPPNQNVILLGEHLLWPGATTICPDGSGGRFKGQEVDLEVWNPTNLAAVQFRFLYDPTVVTVIDPGELAHPELACADGVESINSVLPHASTVVNYETGAAPDKHGLKGLQIALASTNGTSQSGKLIQLYFQAKGASGSRTALSFDPSYDFVLGSADNRSPQLDGTVQTGSIAIISTAPTPPVLGDVNGDGTINLLDVEALLSAVVGRTVLAGPAGVADLNGNGQIDIADVRLLLLQVLGL